MARTLGQVAEYWLTDPQARARSAVRASARSYLDLWAHCGQAHGRRTGRRRSPTPDPRDRRFTDPEWSANQFFDFLKQAYLLTAQWADHLVKRRRRARSAHAAEGRVLRAADRQRDRALELRAHQSGAAARDAVAPTPRTSCAACTCWPRTSRPGGGDLKIRQTGRRQVRGRPQSRGHARQGRSSRTT